MGGCGHKTEVREAGTGRDIVGYEDVRLSNFKKGSVTKLGDTDTFEIPVYEMSIVKVPQTLGRVVQLLSHFSGGSSREVKTTNQFQPIGAIIFDIVHDGPVRHPL